MKQLNVIIVILLAIAGLFGVADAVWAQADLLPEKTDTVSTSNSTESSLDNSAVPVETVSSDTATASKNLSSDEEHSWGGIITVLMLAALFLLFLEIAIIPGFGICGIAGIVLLLGSIGLAYWKLTTDMAVIVTVVAVVCVLLFIAFVFWVFPQTRMGRKFVLLDTAPSTEEQVNPLARFMGAEGLAVSNLRPSGIAKIADERVDVITEGDFVEKGTKIKVVKVAANRVIVAPIEE